MPRVIDGINEPAQLKGLSYDELNQLAAEIRDELVATVSNNGGHLASNLGVVELTLGLHRVFDSPQDRIVWDVGHQSYVHKLLTGRRDQFGTIRCYDGLSGYPDRAESVHDAFGTGHASTAISAALGMALARDLAHENHHVVAVVGDGALTGGMAFEAINHAGQLGSRLIIILNDNEMFISPGVGALSRALGRVRLNQTYYRTKEGAEQVVRRMPGGRGLWSAARAAKESLKRLLLPTLLWEELGFTYIGPIDGHDQRQIESALAQARDYTARPVLIHVITTKGKGYAPAEDDAVAFHGVAPNGNGASSAPSYSSVFGRTTLELMRANPKVVAIVAAMADGTGLAKVAAEMPERFFDVGICEQHAVTLAASLASQGYRPIVAVYSTFLQRAYDQILHDVCIQNLPVTFALDRAGIVGDDGKTHQGLFDISYLRQLPEMIVSAPKDEDELRHLLFTALNHDGPMSLRYPRGGGSGAPLDAELRALPIGKGEALRWGDDVAIVAIGNRVAAATEAAERLAERGVACAVINARFAKPLDAELILETATRTRRIVTVEENALAGGFGSGVLELLAAAALPNVSAVCLGIPDEFVAHGPPDVFRQHYGIDADGIVTRVLTAFPELDAKAAAEVRLAR